MDTHKIAGCLFGMAFGDALGADTEFLQVAAILRKYPPNGPQELRGNPARVTDDTQMALAVGEALISAPQPFEAKTLETELRRTFGVWYENPENNRAPGNTCMAACRNLKTGMTWQEATRMGSKGCGANMRVMPVALLAVDDATRAKIAQFQAALTHGHPTGLAAADLTAFIMAQLGEGLEPAKLLSVARDYAIAQREVYHEDWLGDMWRYTHTVPSPEEFIARGWDECLHGLDRLDNALTNPATITDPCLATGAGWVAEEALATALLCFLMYSNNPLAVIRRAVVTSGDSDSIACIAGAFAGAYHGLAGWPTEWIGRIEYRDQLETLASELAKSAS